LYKDKLLLSPDQNKFMEDHYLKLKRLCAQEWTFTELPTLNCGTASGIIFLVHMSARKKHEKNPENLKVLLGKKVQSSFKEMRYSEQRSTLLPYLVNTALVN